MSLYIIIELVTGIHSKGSISFFITAIFKINLQAAFKSCCVRSHIALRSGSSMPYMYILIST